MKEEAFRNELWLVSTRHVLALLHSHFMLLFFSSLQSFAFNWLAVFRSILLFKKKKNNNTNYNNKEEDKVSWYAAIGWW